MVDQLVKNFPPFMDPVVHRRVHKDWPLEAILSQKNLVYYILTFYFRSILFFIWATVFEGVSSILAIE
jgi:hypothetical protein